MRAEDLQTFIRSSPFRSFRITMNSGRSYDVRHPEMIRLTRSAAFIFFADDPVAPAEHVEMISLILIERVEQHEVPVPPSKGNGQTSA
jgi:hypothetical protein